MTFAELIRRDRAEHERDFRAGKAVGFEALAGWEFRGWNCSLAPRLGGFQKFTKGFVEGPDGRAEGYNCPVIQNGADGDWLALPADDAPKRFGFYLVRPASTAEARGAPEGSLLLDYGAHPANPRLDPSRLLRDVVVAVDDKGDVLLGRAHLALGPWIFAGFFALERHRPNPGALLRDAG